ncbi:MAG: adenylate/guanylate cyclase domain-containing protein [Planctomycetota bacterium]|jgi:class 3 adenylate cyclase|nr:adenylate/guanylate cyclase domain-containing protein [Planctomycetota bacterium]MDP6502350.1 adenylate/guanylate cyclase domain-containing protein [Planctomycetota bacterium]
MQKFHDLLLAYSHADPEEQKTLEAELWSEYGHEAAIFVLDMSGFSLLTQKYGVIHYLSMVSRMHVTVKPIIEHHGGQVVKFEADNCFARFPTPTDAIQAAIEVNHTFNGMNLLTAEEFDIVISCGIDYGKFLLVEEGQDFFGNPINRASKLGEDLAERGEILATQDAMDQVLEGAVKSRIVNYSISGISLAAHRIEY